MVAEVAAARAAQSVLIVDDEPEIRSLLTDILADKGYRIDTAEDGVAALQMVVESHPDLVLLDVDMPRLRGVEAMVAIHGLAPATKVIMISGKADAQEARRALAAGAFDYITKPFDLTYLDEAVRIAMLS